MPDLIIDGRAVSVPKGTTVIEAAEAVGIVIPRLCWHKALGAAGACRLCAVMRFALFFVGEYVNMILLGSLTAIFFLGGWNGPFLPPIVWLAIKVLAVPIFCIWTRASLPRLRYDQLMNLCWKALVPLALVNILVTGAVLALGH